jgi:hypothetical protein
MEIDTIFWLVPATPIFTRIKSSREIMAIYQGSYNKK